MTHFPVEAYDALVKAAEAQQKMGQLYVRLAEDIAQRVLAPKLWPRGFPTAQMRQISRVVPFTKRQRRVIGRRIRRDERH